MSKDVCSICLEAEAKYTCPACDTKTCSVACVKRHKLRSECSGSVDPTVFVPHKTLAASSALVNRDYNFLLNFERRVQLSKTDLKANARNVFKRTGSSHQANSKRPRTNDSDPRIAQANKVFGTPQTSVKRENTLVIHVTLGMSRATQNKSGYDKKSGAFTWTVEWVPVDKAGVIQSSFISFRLKETLSLVEAVPLAVLASSLNQEIDVELLRFYLDNCVSTTTKSPSLIELDAHMTISASLAEKVVLEYPRIYVALDSSTMAENVQSQREAYGLESESDSDSESNSDSETDSSDDEPEELSSKLPAKIVFEVDAKSENLSENNEEKNKEAADEKKEEAAEEKKEEAAEEKNEEAAEAGEPVTK